MVYASAATGYRLPGFNTRVFQAGQVEQQFPTSLISYEVGFKADFFDRRLRLNGAAFWMAYSMRNGSFSGMEPRYDPNRTDLVILPGDQTLIPDGPDNTQFSNDFTNCRPYNAATDGPPNGTTVGIQCISRSWNYPVSGGDPVRGFELEATIEPIDDLTINGSLGYTDRGSTTGRPIGFPDWTASGGIQYVFGVDALQGTLTPRLRSGIQCISRSWNYPVSGGDPVRGFELEATIEPIDDLTINGSLGYTDRGSTTGRPIGFPDWTASGGIQYVFGVDALQGTLTPRL